MKDVTYNQYFLSADYSTTKFIDVFQLTNVFPNHKKPVVERTNPNIYTSEVLFFSCIEYTQNSYLYKSF